MKAILNRELKSYFNSPLVYILYSIFLVISFIFFMIYNIMYGNSSLLNLCYNLNTIFVFLVPMITMRLFSEEKTQKTDQLLLTSPNTITSIVMGKFLSAFVIYSVMLSVTVLYAIIVACFTSFDVMSYLILIIGELLLGAAFVSVGLFVSSISQSIITSALVSFGLLSVFYFAEMIPAIFGNPEILTKIFGFFSLSLRFNNFGIGLLAIDSIIYYLSFAAIFVFLTIRMIDKKRWS